jgi:uncharacterized protein YggE
MEQDVSLPFGRIRSMSRTAFAVIVLAMLSLTRAAGAQAPGLDRFVVAKSDPFLTTVGRATVKVAPDRAFVTVATEALAASPGAAQQQIARSMTAVRAAVKAAGIPDEAVKTLAYGLQEEADYQNGKRVPRGYRARNTIEVRLDDIARVGDVIDASVKAGANAVTDIRFDVKDRAAVERDALKRAVADAKARADAMAAGAGVTLGAIIRIDETGQAVPLPRPIETVRVRAMAADVAETPVSAGEIEVEATVNLTVAIK